MAEHSAFFYGTLMVPKILYRVCYGTTQPQQYQTSFITVRPALLPSYRRHRVSLADYPGITPVASASVLGTYVTGLTPQDLNRLDMFEGSEYERQDVKVQVLKGTVAEVQADAAAGKAVGTEDSDVELRDVPTQTYVYLNPQRLESQEWDFEEFKREKMFAWTLDDSEEYDDVAGDTQVNGSDGKAHDGTGGRGAGGDITKQLKGDQW